MPQREQSPTTAVPHRAVVTGSAGFIGSHLAHTLVQAGTTVIGVDCRDPSADPAGAANLAALRGRPGYHHITADLRECAIDPLLIEADAVFHLAGIPGVRPSWGSHQIIDRYDKRFCSHTEINHFYTPGTHTVVFDVDGFRFGTLVCIEINFPELFCEYEQLGVDCLLLSAYPIDAIFHVKARALAAINNYWLALSTPAQTRQLVPSGLIGPHGQVLANAGNDQMLVVADLDRTAPDLHIAINLARPWRAAARQGDIYRTRHVSHPRSTNRTNA
jgi:hypothetical protein